MCPHARTHTRLRVLVRAFARLCVCIGHSNEASLKAVMPGRLAPCFVAWCCRWASAAWDEQHPAACRAQAECTSSFHLTLPASSYACVPLLRRSRPVCIGVQSNTFAGLMSGAWSGASELSQTQAAANKPIKSNSKVTPTPPYTHPQALLRLHTPMPARARARACIHVHANVHTRNRLAAISALGSITFPLWQLD